MINKLMMITNSKLYAKHYFEDIDLIFTINDEFVDEVFEAFLDKVHEKMLIPSLKLCCEVSQIAKMWNSEGIIVLFDEESMKVFFHHFFIIRTALVSIPAIMKKGFLMKSKLF